MRFESSGQLNDCGGPESDFRVYSFSLLESIHDLLAHSGAEAIESGDYGEAEKFCQEALNISFEIGDTKRKIADLRELGRIATYHKDYERAEKSFQEALSLAQEMRNVEAISDIFFDLNRLNSKWEKPEQAEDYQQKGITILREQLNHILTDPDNSKAPTFQKWKAMPLIIKMGVRLLEDQELEQARSLFIDFITIIEDVNTALEARGFQEEEQKLIYIHIRSLIAIGLIEDELEDYAQAESCLSEAVSHARQHGYKVEICELLLYLGIIETETKDYDQAFTRLQEANVLASEMDHTLLLSKINLASGDLALEQKKFKQAQEEYLQALRNANTINRLGLVASAKFGLARVLSELGEKDLSQQSAVESVRIYETLNDPTAEHVKQWLAQILNGGNMERYQSTTSVPVPEGWRVKESITLLSPDGHSNLIVSREPLDPQITSQEYAKTQKELLRKEFPDYREHAFAKTELQGGKKAYLHRFQWKPPNSEDVTQIQVYYSNNGVGITATATCRTLDFEHYENEIRQVLGGITFED